jgi:hypothetical protein
VPPDELSTTGFVAAGESGRLRKERPRASAPWRSRKPAAAYGGTRAISPAFHGKAAAVSPAAGRASPPWCRRRTDEAHNRSVICEPRARLGTSTCGIGSLRRHDGRLRRRSRLGSQNRR